MFVQPMSDKLQPDKLPSMQVGYRNDSEIPMKTTWNFGIITSIQSTTTEV
jgi:hypothetical protein